MECRGVFFCFCEWYLDEFVVGVIVLFVVLFVVLIVYFHSALTFLFVVNSQTIGVINNFALGMDNVVRIGVVSEVERGKFPTELLESILELCRTFFCFNITLTFELVCVEDWQDVGLYPAVGDGLALYETAYFARPFEDLKEISLWLLNKV